MLILQSEVFFQSKIRISWGIGVSLRDVQEKPVAGRARVANILSPADYFFWKIFTKLKLHNPMLIFICPLLADYLRHAPCMRLVQAGYERCAADYQTRIKALNEQTQVSIPIRILKDL